MAETAVTVNNLSKVFLTRSGQPVEALRSLGLTIDHGQVVAVLGPSGCGKTSFLRVLAGLDRSYQGEVIWHNDPTRNGQRSGRLGSATVFQSDSTLPWMTVQHNVELGLESLRLPADQTKQRVDRVLTMVGLHDFRRVYPHELSGGMRQRVAIARALATEPYLLVMDEPLASLDAQTRVVMQQELLQLWQETDSTVVYVTHDIEEAVTLADRVIVLSARPGRIIEDKEIPFGRARTVTDLRVNPEFGKLVVDFWQTVADEVGMSLSSTPARAESP